MMAAAFQQNAARYFADFHAVLLVFLR